MAFLARLLMRFGSWLKTSLKSFNKPSNKGQIELGDDEIVSRFIYSKSNFSRPAMKARPNAFDPSPHIELSGAHTTLLDHSTVWNLGKLTLVDAPGRRTIYARADVRVVGFREQKLRAVRDDDPFDRHTTIHGWPPIPDALQRKEVWKLICLELSQSTHVNLVIPSSPISIDNNL